MEELLLELLNQLEKIGEVHEELYDSECRERMSQAILDGFVDPVSTFMLPSDFGLYSSEANKAVKDALEKFIESSKLVDTQELQSAQERLAAFQNESIHSDAEGIYYDDVFGYWDPASFLERDQGHMK